MVNKNCKKLDQGNVVEFHNLVAKTLCDTKRAIYDTCIYILFMTTRVRVLNEDDWNKLEHMMQYLRGTIKISLNLSANRSGILKWWMDELFSVHPNMQ